MILSHVFSSCRDIKMKWSAKALLKHVRGIPREPKAEDAHSSQQFQSKERIIPLSSSISGTILTWKYCESPCLLRHQFVCGGLHQPEVQRHLITLRVLLLHWHQLTVRTDDSYHRGLNWAMAQPLHIHTGSSTHISVLTYDTYADTVSAPGDEISFWHGHNAINFSSFTHGSLRRLT